MQVGSGGGQGPLLAFKGISKELLKDTASKPHTSIILAQGLTLLLSTRTTSWVCTGQEGRGLQAVPARGAGAAEVLGEADEPQQLGSRTSGAH